MAAGIIGLVLMAGAIFATNSASGPKKKAALARKAAVSARLDALRSAAKDAEARGLKPGVEGDAAPAGVRRSRRWQRSWRSLRTSPRSRAREAAFVETGETVSVFDLLQDMMKLAKSSATSQDPRRSQAVADLDRLGKKQLWEKYGKHFDSKDEAKAAYNKYKSTGKLPGESEPVER